MNNDLISREALKKAFEDYEAYSDIFPKTVYDIIDNAPTVAVNCKDCDGYEAGYSAGLKDEERPQDDIFPMELVMGKCPIEAGGNCPLRQKGKWIEGWDGYFETLDCSLCGYVRNERHLHLNFCPNCGADMRGDKE